MGCGTLVRDVVQLFHPVADGVFLTHKAINDSVILNADTYTNFFKRLFFIREKRATRRRAW